MYVNTRHATARNRRAICRVRGRYLEQLLSLVVGAVLEGGAEHGDDDALQRLAQVVGVLTQATKPHQQTMHTKPQPECYITTRATNPWIPID